MNKDIREAIDNATDVLGSPLDINVHHDVAKLDDFDPWAWCRANPVPTAIGVVVGLLVLRKLL